MSKTDPYLPFPMIIFDSSHSPSFDVFPQVGEVMHYYKINLTGPHRPGLKRPLMCHACNGWFEGEEDCDGCRLSYHQVTIQWDYWLWAAIGQVHNLLQARFRERRGVVELLGVPPPVGLALIRHFATPRAHIQGATAYGPAHASWKQGTSAGKKYHFVKFAYDTMEDVKWAFPLGDYYPKTAASAVRLVSKRRWADVRIWGTPVQFKYKWAAQRTLGETTVGVHVFTITANITHVGIGMAAAVGAAAETQVPRYNIEYARWTAEQQQEQLVAAKDAII